MTDVSEVSFSAVKLCCLCSVRGHFTDRFTQLQRDYSVIFELLSRLCSIRRSKHFSQLVLLIMMRKYNVLIIHSMCSKFLNLRGVRTMQGLKVFILPEICSVIMTIHLPKELNRE